MQSLLSIRASSILNGHKSFDMPHSFFQIVFLSIFARLILFTVLSHCLTHCLKLLICNLLNCNCTFLSLHK